MTNEEAKRKLLVRANLEEQNRDYFQTSLSRWTNRLADEAKRKLLTKTPAPPPWWHSELVSLRDKIDGLEAELARRDRVENAHAVDGL